MTGVLEIQGVDCKLELQKEDEVVIFLNIVTYRVIFLTAPPLNFLGVNW